MEAAGCAGSCRRCPSTLRRDKLHGRPVMAKTTSPAVASILKDIRTALDERVEERARLSPGAKSPLKVIGVRASGVKTVAREISVRHKTTLDYPLAVDLLEAAAGRKVREEILVAIDLLERFRKEFDAVAHPPDGQVERRGGRPRGRRGARRHGSRPGRSRSTPRRSPRSGSGRVSGASGASAWRSSRPPGSSARGDATRRSRSTSARSS